LGERTLELLLVLNEIFAFRLWIGDMDMAAAADEALEDEVANFFNAFCGEFCCC
jgi:hypothetical protein